MTAPRLTERQRDMLIRIALAAKHTSPSTSSGLTREQSGRVIAALKRRGLVVWENGSRLTEAGLTALRAFCPHTWSRGGVCLACGVHP